MCNCRSWIGLKCCLLIYWKVKLFSAFTISRIHSSFLLSSTVYLPKSTKAKWKQAVDESESAEAFDEVVTAEFTDYDEYIEFHGQIR